MYICPKCGSVNMATAAVCRRCSTQLAGQAAPAPYITQSNQQLFLSSPRVCNSCQAANDPVWAYCMNCGAPLDSSAPSTNPPVSYPDARPTTVEAIKPTDYNPMAASPAESEVYQAGTPAGVGRLPAEPIPEELVSHAGDNNQLAPKTIQTTNELTLCPACRRGNSIDNELCKYCQTPMPRTLKMGSELRGNTPPSRLQPRLRLMDEQGSMTIYDINTDELVIGRNSGDIRFPKDGYMSGRHARIERRGNSFFLIDEHSRNGSFKRIEGEISLQEGDVILVGKQLFRFEK